MERLRYALGRLNLTVVGIALVVAALGWYFAPQLFGPHTPPPAVTAPVGQATAQPGQPEAAPPIAPAAAQPGKAQHTQPAGPDADRHAPAEPRAPRGPEPGPPAPRPHGWANGVMQWVIGMFAFTGGMTALASLLLVGLLLWRSFSLRQRDVVNHP